MTLKQHFGKLSTRARSAFACWDQATSAALTSERRWFHPDTY
jgi:hypothetical protein